VTPLIDVFLRPHGMVDPEPAIKEVVLSSKAVADESVLRVSKPKRLLQHCLPLGDIRPATRPGCRQL
jgi:hypothetical protein